MSTISYSIERVNRVLKTIDSLRGSEFPYEESRFGLERVDQLFKEIHSDLTDMADTEEIDDDDPVVQTHCSEALDTIFNYLPLIGFILRSTNVRNAFEVHGPVSRIAQELLSNNTKLIISSEWDYSPFVYKRITGLEEFVLLGLPAPESSNPLLIPLVGHELGHSLWSLNRQEYRYDTIVTDYIQQAIDTDSELQNQWKSLYDIPSDIADVWSDIEYSGTIGPSTSWAVKQSEETFCDFVGLRIFGQSYLNAFAYLLCPGEEYRGSVEYPSMLVRIDNLIKAAKSWNIEIPDGYEKQFVGNSSLPPFVQDSDSAKLQLKLADNAFTKAINTILNDAVNLTEAKGFDLPDKQIIKEIISRFKLTVPYEGTKQLGNILNAGWISYHNDDLWAEYNHIPRNVRRSRLKELVLKNIEILDYEQRKNS